MNSWDEGSDKSIVDSMQETADMIEESSGPKPPEEHWLIFGDKIVDLMLENDWIDPTPDEEFEGRVNEKLHEEMAEALMNMDEDESTPVPGYTMGLPVLPPIGTKVYRNQYMEPEAGSESTMVMTRESDLIDFHKDDLIDDYFRE